MPGSLPLKLAERLAGRAFAARLMGGRFLNLGLGVTLLRDGRVPARYKAAALGASAAVMTGLVALEVPLEGILAVVVPFLGPMVDLAADGAEETLGTLVLATLLLPRIVPREVLAEIRAELDAPGG